MSNRCEIRDTLLSLPFLRLPSPLTNVSQADETKLLEIGSYMLCEGVPVAVHFMYRLGLVVGFGFLC